MAYLCSYIPASIVTYLGENVDKKTVYPTVDQYTTVVLFADVSGYTALCEAMAAMGPGGDEYLAKNLNSYFELLVKSMSSFGGDVFKFAGDAVIAVWPRSDDDLVSLARRASQCALEIKMRLQDAVMAPGVTLNIKIGIGAGEISIVHLGGVNNRVEYLAIGDPLAQAFHAEHQATKREVIASPVVWKLISEYFEATFNEAEEDDGHGKNAFLKRCIKPMKKVSIFSTTGNRGGKEYDPAVLKEVSKYIPPAVIPFATQKEDKWISQLRRITVLFVNLGVTEEELIAMNKSIAAIHRLNVVLSAVQKEVYQYEGSLNKFLMDDKGSTLIAVFGMPPLAHEDDALRGVLAAFGIIKALHALNLRPSVGITTGNAFCGVVGSRGRREYSALGDTVNLSARLMQHATKTGATLLCDANTVEAASLCHSLWYKVEFLEIAPIKVKGKSKPIEIFKPVEDKMKSIKFPVAGHMRALLEEERSKNRIVKDEELISHVQTYKDILANQSKSCETIILESEVGMGKGKVFLSIINSTPPDRRIVFAAGHCFDLFTPLVVWAEVFNQLMEFTDLVERRQYIRHAIEAVECHEAAALVPCLNEVYDYDFEETDETFSMDSKTRLDHAKELSVVLLQHFSSKQQLLIAVDDGTFIDNDSWDVAADVAEKVTNVIMLIALRPMDKIHMSPAIQEVPKSYLKLAGMSTTTGLTIETREAVLILGVATKVLGLEDVSSIPTNLQDLIIERATGNPFYAKEFLEKLLQEELVVVHSGKVGSSPKLFKSLVQLPIPIAIEMVVAAKLDRLNLCQQMILRVAAMIGYSFSLKLVIKAFPITETEATINKEVKSLVDLDILEKVSDCELLTDRRNSFFNLSSSSSRSSSSRSSTSRQSTSFAGSFLNRASFSRRSFQSGSKAGNMGLSRRGSLNVLPDSIDEEDSGEDIFFKKTHKFNNKILRDFILSRTLDSHRTALLAAKGISTHSDLVNQQNNELVPEGEKVFKESILEGEMFKRGGKIRTQKRRYFILFQDKLVYYKSKSETKITKGEILIDKDLCVEGDGDEGEGSFTVTPGNIDRTFDLKADSDEIAEKWIRALDELVFEKIRLHNENKSTRTSRMKAGSIVFQLDQIQDALSAFDEGEKIFQESMKEGYLMKRGDSIKTWKKRYFILFENKLLYYKTKQTTHQVQGEIPFCSQTIVKEEDIPIVGHASFPASLSVTPNGAAGGRTYYITAKDSKTAAEWVQAIKFNVDSMEEIKSEVVTKKLALHSMKEGWLRKKGGMFGSWKTRYIVLYANQLEWYIPSHNQPIDITQQPEDLDSLGSLELYWNTKVEVKDMNFSIFTSNHHKIYTLGAKDAEEAEAWAAAIKAQAATLQKT